MSAQIKAYVLLAVILLWLGSIAATWIYRGHIVAETVTAQWTKRELDQSKADQAIIWATESKYRDEEHWHANQLAALADQYQKEQSNAQAANDRIITSLRAGTRRLSIIAARAKTDCLNVSKTSTSPSGNNEAATVELPAAASANLYDIAGKADQVADQLRACQEIILQDRR